MLEKGWYSDWQRAILSRFCFLGKVFAISLLILLTSISFFNTFNLPDPVNLEDTYAPATLRTPLKQSARQHGWTK